jgi:hypothetical protein
MQDCRGKISVQQEDFINVAYYGTETLIPRKIDEKHLKSSEMWCWRRMEKISWADRKRSEDVLRRVLRTMKKRKADWIGHIFRRHCPLKPVIEEKIERMVEVTGRRIRRCKWLVDNLTEIRGY